MRRSHPVSPSSAVSPEDAVKREIAGPTLALILLFCAPLAAQRAGVSASVRVGQTAVTPSMTINGVTSTDNTGEVHLTRQSLVTIELTGTPGVQFSLYLSRDANLANPDFFLRPWVPTAPPNVNSPIHIVFEGIGVNYVVNNLPGLELSDFTIVPSSPVFKFDSNGRFVVTALLPDQALLVDNDPVGPTGPGRPFVLPLESTQTFNSFLYFQVVSFNNQGGGILVGNGMKMVFDALEYPGTVVYSEGQDANQASIIMGSKQNLGRLVHPDLSDGQGVAVNTALSDFSAGGFQNNTDIWMINLAGQGEITDPSLPPNSNYGLESSPGNPDFLYTTMHTYSSGLEVNTGTRPERNNDNKEFPRISLPGNKELFHWRNGGSNPTQYGFGVLFRDSGRFRNLVPVNAPGWPFTGTATLSPWEVEVGVTPDGTRAMVILDATSNNHDKIFVLNLEEGGNFANGLPIADVTPGDTTLVRRVFEESINFVHDGAGGWMGFVASSSNTSASTSLYADRLWKVGMNGDLSSVRVLPTSSSSTTPSRMDRSTFVSDDHSTLCIIGGSTSTREDIWSITSVTRFSHAVLNITDFPITTPIMESNDTSDGKADWTRLSRDGSLLAFATGTTASNQPRVVMTNGSQAGAVPNIVVDVLNSGDFDLNGDFPNCVDLRFTDDNSHLVWFQGLYATFASSDRYDLFTYDLDAELVLNRTRTISGPEYTGPGSKAFAGPWDVPAASASTHRPNFDPGGSFLSANREFLILGRDARGIPGKLSQFNFVAMNIGSSLTFDMLNIFGKEFERSLDLGPPAFGTIELKTDATAAVEPTPGFFRLRRVGGNGGLRNWYYLCGRLVSYPSGDANIEQLFLFDGNNPGPALRLTNFSTSGTPFVVGNGSTITSVTPSKTEAKVAFILNRNDATTAATQNLIVLDLDQFAIPVALPDPSANVVWNKAFTGGSIHWVPDAPAALVYSRGSVVRPSGSGAGATDGVFTSQDPYNPIDAAPYFYTFLEDGVESPLATAPAGNNRRSVFIWGLAD